MLFFYLFLYWRQWLRARFIVHSMLRLQWLRYSFGALSFLNISHTTKEITTTKSESAFYDFITVSFGVWIKMCDEKRWNGEKYTQRHDGTTETLPYKWCTHRESVFVWRSIVDHSKLLAFACVPFSCLFHVNRNNSGNCALSLSHMHAFFDRWSDFLVQKKYDI